MTETREAVADLWDALRRDGQNFLEYFGLEPTVVGPIVATVLLGAAVWFVLNNLFG
jgi:hypothetical protein